MARLLSSTAGRLLSSTKFHSRQMKPYQLKLQSYQSSAWQNPCISSPVMQALAQTEVLLVWLVIKTFFKISSQTRPTLVTQHEIYNWIVLYGLNIVSAEWQPQCTNKPDINDGNVQILSPSMRIRHLCNMLSSLTQLNERYLPAFVSIRCWTFNAAFNQSCNQLIKNITVAHRWSDVKCFIHICMVSKIHWRCA